MKKDVQGLLSAPWRTLEHAIDETSEANAPPEEDLAFITIRGGTYYFSSMLHPSQQYSHLAIRSSSLGDFLLIWSGINREIS
jgi:hypothetical protein